MAVQKIPGVISLVTGDESATAIYTKTLMVQGFYWEVTATGVADDNVIVTDGAGNRIWSATAAAKDDERSLSFAEPIPVTGLKVTALDDGVLYIYVSGALPSD